MNTNANNISNYRIHLLHNSERSIKEQNIKQSKYTSFY